jgi:hypothetical protein
MTYNTCMSISYVALVQFTQNIQIPKQNNFYNSYQTYK